MHLVSAGGRWLLMVGKSAWHQLLDEECQQLSLVGHDLLAYDETGWVQLPCQESTHDGIMVGDHQPVDALLLAGGEQVLISNQRILGVGGMAVELGFHQFRRMDRGIQIFVLPNFRPVSAAKEIEKCSYQGCQSDTDTSACLDDGFRLHPRHDHLSVAIGLE